MGEDKRFPCVAPGDSLYSSQIDWNSIGPIQIAGDQVVEDTIVARGG
jgi:hypothetical protein